VLLADDPGDYNTFIEVAKAVAKEWATPGVVLPRAPPCPSLSASSWTGTVPARARTGASRAFRSSGTRDERAGAVLGMKQRLAAILIADVIGFSAS